MAMKEVWTSAASLMGVLAFCESLLHSIFPDEIRDAVVRFISRYVSFFSPYCYFDLLQIDNVGTNELYDAAEMYLSHSPTIVESATRLTVRRSLNSSFVTFGLSDTDTFADTFRGASIQWKHSVKERPSKIIFGDPLLDEKRHLTLRLKKMDKNIVLHPYLNHIVASADEIRGKNKDRLLYTNRCSSWKSVVLKHPSTFDTLAMDPTQKSEIMNDLLDFSNGESFYNNVGRAWKRGYLLYGPPGTGKSSMIAAMANFLRYNIYDLELTEIKKNTQLRKLLMKTTRRSIIVIEDIDCSTDLGNREKKHNTKRKEDENDELSGDEKEDDTSSSLTLSGLLNFTDGLWSCCGDERIFVFTTNHVEKLDPALLRSGRMDMHIHMSFCTYPTLKILLKNYFELSNYSDLEETEVQQLEALIDGAEITPADAAELLIKNRRDMARAVQELCMELRRRTEKSQETTPWTELDQGDTKASQAICV